MFNFIFVRSSIRALPTQKRLHLFQLNHLLSSQSTKTQKKLLSENGKDHSVTVNYLINKCGFAPEKAISASKYINVNNPEKADAVIAFLKNQGFSETQVLKIVKTHPRVILSDPGKTLLPKIDFFLSQGVCKADLLDMFSTAPEIFKTSLDRAIIPTFNCLKELLGSPNETILPMKRCQRMFALFLNHVVYNIELLRKIGVPEDKIRSLAIHFPRTLICPPDKFKKVLETLREMGVDPVITPFASAINAIVGLSKSSWKKKIEIYNKWGCSEDEVMAAFLKNPWCMTISEEKIDGVIGYFVNELNWDPSRLLQSPQILSCSLNRKIIPRCSVYKVLLSKGFIKEHFSLYSMVKVQEEKFLQRYIECYEKEAPELLKIYHEKMKLSRGLTFSGENTIH